MKATDIMVAAIAESGGETWWHERPPSRGDMLVDKRDGAWGSFTGEEKTSWPPQFVVRSGERIWSIPAAKCQRAVPRILPTITEAEAYGRLLDAAVDDMRETRRQTDALFDDADPGDEQ